MIFFCIFAAKIMKIKALYRRFRDWQINPFRYQDHSDHVERCANCGTEFQSNFCPVCGQKAGVGPIGWKSVRQGLMIVWGMDSRSLGFSLLQLLFRPGYLISDYISATTHKATLGEIVELLKSFAEQPKTLMIPEIPENSFAKKLYSTYLSYLPKEKVAFPLKMNVDDRGSFTELVHTLNAGQVSINISKPGITKGQHWHNTKWEFFIVVAGHGLIQERKLGTDEVIEFEVSGDNIQCIHMLPGYTHNIINLSDTENLVTVMYCNEIFNPEKPDTFFEKV